MRFPNPWSLEVRKRGLVLGDAVQKVGELFRLRREDAASSWRIHQVLHFWVMTKYERIDSGRAERIMNIAADRAVSVQSVTSSGKVRVLHRRFALLRESL